MKIVLIQKRARVTFPKSFYEAQITLISNVTKMFQESV